MQKEMGNQNTSGIVEEKAQEAGSVHDSNQENHTQILEEEIKDFDAKAAESDSCDAEVGKSPHVERLSCDEKEVSEEANGHVSDGCATETNGLPNIPSKEEELKESNLKESMSKFNEEEENDQLLSTLKGEIQIQKSDLNSDPKLTSNLSCVLQEMSVSCHVEGKCDSIDTKLTQNLDVSVDSGIIDDCVFEKKGDGLVLETEMTLVEGTFLEMNTFQEKCDMVLSTGNGNIENGIRNEELVDNYAKEEMGGSRNAPNDLPSLTKDISSMENEVHVEGLVIEEKKPRVSDDQTQFSEEVIKDGIEDDQTVKEISMVQTGGSVMMDKNQENDKLTIERTVEKKIANNAEYLSATGNEHGSGTSTMDKREWNSKSILETKSADEPELEPKPEPELEPEPEPKHDPEYLSRTGKEHESASTVEKHARNSESLLETKRANDPEPEPEPQPQPDQPGRMFCVQYTNKETSTLQVLESNGRESVERLSIESNPNHPMFHSELRKSPSFDFGLPFDARSEESDQTPLLYQDRTAIRSFSSCSTFGNPIHYKPVEADEKTIRMERSNSDVSKAPFFNLTTEEKQGNPISDKNRENGLKGSLSTEDRAVISPKRNGKRKPRSSLFSTCICCTASAIG